MNEADVLLSRLAIDQIAQLTPTIGRALLDALTTLARFPESAPRVPLCTPYAPPVTCT